MVKKNPPKVTLLKKMILHTNKYLLLKMENNIYLSKYSNILIIKGLCEIIFVVKSIKELDFSCFLSVFKKAKFIPKKMTSLLTFKSK